MDAGSSNNQPSKPGLRDEGSGEVKFDIPTTHGAPSCQVCGRRDETLRAVVIPFVFSLLVITIRRSWSGVFCWRHRIQRLIGAGLITALAGWWGIPWGLIYTPLNLFKLASGGEIPEDENVELLARVAVHKVNTGEPEEAIKTFREGLRIKEDERTRNSLLQLQAKYPLYSEVKESRIPYWYLGAFVGASLLGMGFGLFDFLVTQFLSWIVGSETHFLVGILTWAPFVAMIFIGALVLNEGIRWIFERTSTDHLLMGIVVALGVAGLVWYGIPQGYLVGEYFSAIFNGLSIESAGDFILTTGAVITQGGLWFVLDSIESGLVGDVIYLVIWGLAGIFYAWLGIRSAQDSVHWQVRLELLEGELRIEEPRSRLPAWGAIGGFAFVFILGFAIFAGRGRLLRGGPDLVAYMEQGDAFSMAGDYQQAEDAYRQAIEVAPGQAGPHDSLGWVLYSVGRFEEAAEAFSRAMELDRGWADPHVGMAYVHLSQGQSEDAAAAFQRALELADEPYFAAQAYYGLGNLAHQSDDLQTAIAYYEQAVREDWQLAIAHMDMAIAYYAMGDYPRAIEHANDILGVAPDWGAPHALLALANFALDETEDMNRELEWAEDLDSEDLYSRLLLADTYWGLEDYEQAEAVLHRAELLYPENRQAPLLIARLAALQQDFGRANSLVDGQIGRDPTLIDGYLTRARVKIEQQDLGAAEAALNEALRLSPEDWESHSLRSFVYFHQGRIEEAHREADAAVQAYPYDAATYAYRAFSGRARGNLETAFADAQRAAALAPKLDLAYFILGVLQFDLGDSEAGAENLRMFLELARDRAYVRDYVIQAQAFLDQLP